MIDHNSNEVVIPVAMPRAAIGTPVLAKNARRTSLTFNMVEVAAANISVLISNATPTGAPQMYQLPFGGIIRMDGTGVPVGDVYVLAAASTGTLKIIETE